jgi:hypothetical protein
VQRPFFTLILVSLNPGDALGRTLESITRQTFSDYAMIIKKTNTTIEILEGGEDLPEGEPVRLYTMAELRRVMCLDTFPDDPEPEAKVE